jgi:hypothetical protein
MKKTLSLLIVALLGVVGVTMAQNTYTATFQNKAGWEHVYAYAWSEDGGNVQKFLGEWPGTELTAANGLYTVSITADAAPEKIIFNNGNDQQTADLVFENAALYNAQGRLGVIPEGTYYVLNAAYDEPQLLMAAGHNWGTKGIVNERGLDFTFTYNQSNNSYDIDSRVSNGGNNHFLSSGLWMDGPSYGWTIEGDFVYTISGTFDGVKKYIAVDSNNELVLTEDGTADNAQWAFLKKDYWENEVIKAKGLEAMQAATVAAPADATFLIKTPDFNRNDLRNEENWTIEAGNKNLKGGGDNGYGCAESYHSAFTLSQLLADAPKGVYSMTAQGYYRQDGSTTEDLPVFYANDETGVFPVRTGNENSMNAAGAAFAQGNYTIEPIFVQVTEAGQLTIGAKGTATSQWVIWDNFQLKYYGADVTVDQVKNAALFAKVDELKQQLGQLIASGDIEVEAEVTKLNNALTQINATEITTAGEAELAIVALNAAIDEANGYISAKTILPQMKKLTESTNFYTQEALENYYGQWYRKYEAAELTAVEAKALQDPFVVTGWRANNNVDDLLMSTWDAEPMDWAKYYINTWSVEGATDGTDFAVPFFEYWTGDANSLGERVLTGTMTGLEPGTYGVSAWVRVRGKNGFTAPAYGITMQAGNGEAVSAVAATAVPNSNFYVGQITAIGEVDQNGVLTLKFNVAADNNISWLSFKNVKFNKMQTFTAKFENNDAWDKVYAYTWTGGDYDKVEQLGAWPGTELTAGENGIYNVTVAANEAPANIIFNNGLEGENLIQTKDLAFVDGKTYTDRPDYYLLGSFNEWTASDDNKLVRNADAAEGVVEYMITLDIPANSEMKVNDTNGVWYPAKGNNFLVNDEGNYTVYFRPNADGDEFWFEGCIYCHYNGEPTGISNVKTAVLNGAQIYNLNGQRLTKAQKGLNIIGGKKVVVK